MRPALDTIGYYRSPTGGARAPYTIPPGRLRFELITDGAVVAPESDNLRGVGWVFVHRPGQQTIWRAEPGRHYACLTVRFNLSQEPAARVWQRSFCWEHQERAVEFAHEMRHAFHHASLDRSVLGNYVWSQFRYRQDWFQRQKRSIGVPDRLLSVMRFMDQHYAEPLGIDAMAAHVGISASHLHALFRKHIQLSPHQYLIRQRMRAARHLLVTGTQPVKAVASHVGYANPENFCRVFRRYTGMTAAAYRRTYQIHGCA